MRIVHVVDSLDVGGAEILVSQLCRMQRERGHVPSVYAISRLGALGEQMLEKGFEVRHDLGNKLSAGVRNLSRAFRQDRPDVVHFHNPTPTIYGAGPARMAGVRSILSTRHSLVSKPHRVLEELKYALAALFCDHVVGICDATVSNLRSLHTISPGKLARVYNGVAPLVRVSADQCPHKEGFTLLFVGRLEPVKNLTLLLQAFLEAHKRNPDLRLWVVGDGSERPKLKAFAQSLGIAAVVTFWGQQLDVAPFFSAADIFAMSSVSEGLPLSLLQAFSLGLPAVVTDVGGMAEVVCFANAGVVVPVGAPEQMANAILALVEDPGKLHSMCANAVSAFHSHFSLKEMVSAYHALYSREYSKNSSTDLQK